MGLRSDVLLFESMVRAATGLQLWADPKGEFQSAKHAEPAFKLLGKSGFDLPEGVLEPLEQGEVNQPVHGPRAFIGYHRRSGGHDVLAYDWDQYLRFAQVHFGGAAEAAGTELATAEATSRL